MSDSSKRRVEEIGLMKLHSLEEEKQSFVLEVSASWCHPCKLIESVLEELSAEPLELGLRFYAIDVDSNSKILDEYDVNSVPTIFFFKNGKIVHKLKGYYRKKTIVEVIQKDLSG